VINPSGRENGGLLRGMLRACPSFDKKPVVRNCWTVKQDDNGLLSRWSERPEKDAFVIGVICR